MDSNMLYQMLTSSPEDAEMAMIIIKNNHKNINREILKIYNFYRILRQKSYETWSFGKGRETHIYSLSLKIPVYLNLSHSHITHEALPKGLTVNSNLDLSFNKGLRKLPDDLTVTGSLNIAHTNIKEIPKNLDIYSLQFLGTPLLKRFGEDQIEDLISEIRKKGGKIRNK